MLGRRRRADGCCAARRRVVGARGRRLRRRDDRRVGADRPAAFVHHDRLVARVRDRGQALQLPGQARAGRAASSSRRSPRGSTSRTAASATRSSSARASGSATAHRSPRGTSSTRSTASPTTTSPHRRAVHHRPQGRRTSSARRTSTTGTEPTSRGVRVQGNRLIINLTRSDGTFLSKITMPFFQATSTKLPLGREIVTVDSITDIPSAGPYALARNDPDVLTSLRRNPYWTTRPRSAAPAEPDRPRPAVEPERADRPTTRRSRASSTRARSRRRTSRKSPAASA